MLVRRLAYAAQGGIFIFGGINALKNAEGHAKVAAPLVEKALDAAPDRVSDPIPSSPLTLVRINGGVQVVAGSLLALGKFPRVSALALAASLVPTTLAGHAFWSAPKEQQANQRIQFLKNLAVLGGLIVTAVDTKGQPGLAWRTGHAVDAAKGNLSDLAHSAGDSVSDLAGSAGDVLSDAQAAVTDRLPL